MSDDAIRYDERRNPQRRASDHVTFWSWRVSDVYSGVGILGIACGLVWSYATLTYEVASIKASVADLRTHGSDEVRTLQGDLKTLSAKLDEHKANIERSDGLTRELYRILLEEKRSRR